MLIEQPWTNRLGVQKISKLRSVLLVQVIQGAGFSPRPISKSSYTLDDRRHPNFDIFERVNCLDDRGESLVRLVYRYALLGRVRKVASGGFGALFVVVVLSSIRRDTAAVQLLAQFLFAQCHVNLLWLMGLGLLLQRCHPQTVVTRRREIGNHPTDGEPGGWSLVW
jgi:hypothetical protein